MTWTAKTYSVGETLTAAMMNNDSDNITAQANGDVGAPKQQTAGIADAAVTGDKMSRTMTTSNFTIAASANYTFRNGLYNISVDGSGVPLVSLWIAGAYRAIHRASGASQPFGGTFLVDSGGLQISELDGAANLTVYVGIL